MSLLNPYGALFKGPIWENTNRHVKPGYLDQDAEGRSVWVNLHTPKGPRKDIDYYHDEDLTRPCHKDPTDIWGFTTVRATNYDKNMAIRVSHLGRSFPPP